MIVSGMMLQHNVDSNTYTITLQDNDFNALWESMPFKMVLGDTVTLKFAEDVEIPLQTTGV